MSSRTLISSCSFLLILALGFGLWSFVRNAEPDPLDAGLRELDLSDTERPSRHQNHAETETATAAAVRLDDPDGGLLDELPVRVRGLESLAWQLDYLPLSELGPEDRTRLLIVEVDAAGLLDQRARSITAANADEVIRLPRSGEGYLLRAQAGDLRSRCREIGFDWSRRDGGHREVVLELERSVTVEILVLDAAGNPAAGVPLIERRRASGAGALAVIWSDEEGVARLSMPWESSGEEARAERMIAFGGPESGATSIPVPQPGARGVLQLPPTGSVTVRMLDEASRPLEVDIGGTLWNNSSAVREDFNFNWSRVSREGYLHYEWVGLGVDLGLGARPLAGGREPTSIFFPGPTSPGEELHLEMKFPEALPMISGRFVDAAGHPLRRASLMISARALDDGQDWGAGDYVLTDDAGDFQQSLGWLHCGEAYELEIVATLGPGFVGGLDAPRVRMRLTEGLKAGNNDLGVLIALPLQTLASGRLLDQSGRPLADRKIELVVIGEKIGFHRFPERAQIATTDENGEFSFQTVDPMPFRLRLLGESRFLSREFSSAATELTLIKAEGGP